MILTNLLNKEDKCDICGGKLFRRGTAQLAHSHTIYIMECENCGAQYDFKIHHYTPLTCPKHMWIFSHREFYDSPWVHSIEMVFKCDRCGQEKRLHQDTYHSGISGRVEINDPRVLGTVILNKSLAKQIIDKPEYKEFYKDIKDEPNVTIIV